MNDKKGVALALVVTFLILVSDEIIDKNRAPKPKRVVAFAIVFLVLGFLSEIQGTAKLAKYFSVLILVGTLYDVGPQLFTKIRTQVTSPSAVTAVTGTAPLAVTQTK